jgi:hypothetical protein
MPLAAILVVYAGLTLGAGAVKEAERSELYRDLAFGTALAAAAYSVVLLILAATDAPNRFTDAIEIIFVTLAFFALLIGLLFLISQGFARLRGRPGR